MTDPLYEGKGQTRKSESVRVLERMGKKGMARNGAVREDAHASEVKFWSACKLNKDGTRSNIPRDKDAAKDYYVQRRLTPDMIRWLRENT
jgi:hypothetical protein